MRAAGAREATHGRRSASGVRRRHDSDSSSPTSPPLPTLPRRSASSRSRGPTQSNPSSPTSLPRQPRPGSRRQASKPMTVCAQLRNSSDTSPWVVGPNTPALTNGLRTYTVDQIFPSDQTPKQLYTQVLQPAVRTLTTGGSVTVMSTGEAADDLLDEQSGLLRWLVEDVFSALPRGSAVTLSCFEVLGEMVNCLLQPHKLNCRLQEQPGLGVTVAGAETLEFTSKQPSKLLAAVSAATTTAKSRNRGRSHVVVRVRVRGTGGVSTVQLLQLSSAGVGGPAGMDRGVFALSNVMEKLAAEVPGHVPWRNSKLTRLLKSSLSSTASTAGKQCSLLVIGNVSMLPQHEQATAGTLEFLARAQALKSAKFEKSVSSSPSPVGIRVSSGKSSASDGKSSTASSVDELEDQLSAAEAAIKATEARVCELEAECSTLRRQQQVCPRCLGRDQEVQDSLLAMARRANRAEDALEVVRTAALDRVTKVLEPAAALMAEVGSIVQQLLEKGSAANNDPEELIRSLGSAVARQHTQIVSGIEHSVAQEVEAVRRAHFDEQAALEAELYQIRNGEMQVEPGTLSSFEAQLEKMRRNCDTECLEMAADGLHGPLANLDDAFLQLHSQVGTALGDTECMDTELGAAAESSECSFSLGNPLVGFGGLVAGENIRSGPSITLPPKAAAKTAGATCEEEDEEELVDDDSDEAEIEDDVAVLPPPQLDDALDDVMLSGCLLSQKSEDRFNPRVFTGLGLNGVRTAAAGHSHLLCVVGDSGDLWGQGNNKNHQLGVDSGISHAAAPVRIAPQLLTRVAQVGCGMCHSIALTAEGAVFTWGYGRACLGHGKAIRDCAEPTRVSKLKKCVVASIAAGKESNGVITTGGNVFTWGSNGWESRLGHNTHKGAARPRLVERLYGAGIWALAAGEKHMLALGTFRGDTSNQVWSWGHGGDGALGHAENKDEWVPKLVECDLWDEEHQRLSSSSVSVNPVSISCGDSHSMVVLESGTLVAFGLGENGRLGLGDERKRTVPTVVRALCSEMLDGEVVREQIKVKAVACGGRHTMVLSRDRQVYTFGFGMYEQLGCGKDEDLLEPTLVEYVENAYFVRIRDKPEYSVK